MIMNPDSAALWQEALSHFEAQRHSAAEACCCRLIASAPQQPMAYAMLARIFHSNGLASTTTFYAFEACRRIGGAHWRDILWVSGALLTVGERGPAHEVLSFIDPHDPANGEVLCELGRQYEALGDGPRASYCFHLAESHAARQRTTRVPVNT
jgi:predicted Zn-dependent protease